MRRADLLAACARGIDAGGLLVVAGPGYGKSVLLAQAVAESDVPAAWCSCDTRMAGGPGLLAHLTAAIEERVPGFGSGLDLGRPLEEVLTAFCNEMDALVADDLLLVLDDVHQLADGPAAAVPGRLAEDLPPQVRLALAGRRAPALPMARLRAGGLIQIDEARLRFDEAEAARMLAGSDLGVGEEQLARLVDVTEGWVAGLVIAARAGGVADASSGRTREALFDYLAGEVLARADPATVRFMEDTSVLSRLTPALAAAVAGCGEDAARAMLRALGERHVLTQRIDAPGEWYRYHHLLSELLRERIRAARPADETGLHGRAATAWAAAGDTLESLRHAAAVGDVRALAEALEPVAESLVAGPSADEVGAWLEAIPDDERAARPGLLIARARLLNTRGSFELAFRASDDAIARLIDLGEHDRAAAALVWLLLNMLAAGTPPSRRILSGERALARLEPSPARPVARVAHSAGLAFAGRVSEARAALAAARAEATDSTHPVEAYAQIVEAFYVDYPAGRGEHAVELLEASADELAGRSDPFDYRVYAVAYLPYVLNSLGRHDDALAATDRHAAMCRARRMTGMAERVANWWRMTAFAGLGRWDELEQALVAPARARGGDGMTHYGYRYRGPAAMLAAHHGDAGAVASHADSAREEMRSHGPSFDHPWILCDLSAAATAVGSAALAVDLADEALRIATSLDLPWGRARAALRRAAAAGFSEAGDPHLAEALRLTEEHGFAGLWSRREVAVAGDALRRALVAQVGAPEQVASLAASCGPEVLTTIARGLADAPANARGAFATAVAGVSGVPSEVVDRLREDRAADVRAVAAASDAGDAARPPLRFRGLGGFAVERGGLPVERAAFGRDKARALLAALLCAGRPVHRDVLLEWFWPELDRERAARAFHVTVHALRRALEPELPRGAPSSVVRSEGERYRLVLGPDDGFDADEMLGLAATPATELVAGRVDRLEAAERLAGPLFPEWPYADWAEERRREVEGARARVLEDLAEALLVSGRAAEAVERAQALVDLEPEQERSHRLLMRALAAAGERGLALRQFHACRALLRRELGIDPGAESRDLYREILMTGEGEPT